MDKGKGKRIDLRSDLGLTRRDLLRRGAVVGGTLLWAAPAVQSITQPAFAGEQNGTVRHACCFCTNPTKQQQFPAEAHCDGLGGGPGDPLNSDADCAAYCSANHYQTSEFHSSTTPFSCGPSIGCVQP
jgi:hypothetical protein